MSLESVRTIIGRALLDRQYRETLLGNPEAALAGYDLTAEETAGLKGLQRERLDAAAGELEGRISKAGLVGPGSLIACDGSSKDEISLVRPIVESLLGRMLGGRG